MNPLTKFHPVWMLPILNEPLIGYTIDFLKKNGIEDIAITLSKEEEIPANLMKDKGLDIFYSIDDKPRGSAGALKDIERYIDKKPFLVITGGLFAGHIGLEALVDFHFERNAAATIGVSGINRCDVTEDISIENDKSIKAFSLKYHLEGKREQWQSSGIYLFNPEVLDFIDKDNYVDIKEQLIPSLLKRNLKVFASEMQGFHQGINSADDYINVHRGIFLTGDYIDYLKDKEEFADDVWAGQNVVISPTAYLLGPLVIGNDCTIGNNAQIIGPAVIGNGCNISDSALIRESILWDGASLSDSASVKFSILGESSNIPKNSMIKNMLVLHGLSAGDVHLSPSELNVRAAIDLSGMISRAVVGRLIDRFLKRAMDLALSLAGIIVLLPVFMLLGFLIKRDSAGPVFYVQNRCGIRGRLFGMIKFRTMVADAEKLHQNLLPQNQADGPVFKIFNDPRVTKIGNFLRRTSLDELPQLFNVLKGEMSLVGPRPLITDEMRFSSTWRATRLKVKPGITGLWQVQGRSETHFHDWIKYDVYYVLHQSFWLDLKILFKTIAVVIKKVGAH